jgi:hypothetical protein
MKYVSELTGMEFLRESVQQAPQATVQAPCAACTGQEIALRKLWSQVLERAHPTDFSWHCQTCGKEVHLAID